MSFDPPSEKLEKQQMQNLNSDAIRKKMKILVRQEQVLLVQILETLKAIEDNNLYLEWAYGSMFDYCVQELGYSEGAAQRRILAMRLTKSVPEVKECLRNGSLSLSVAARAQDFFRKEERLRRGSNQGELDVETKRNVLSNLLNLSARDSERKLVEMFNHPEEFDEKTKPLPGDKTLIQFVADRQLMNQLEKLKSLTSHSNFLGRYDLLFKKLAVIALDKLDPERKLLKRQKRIGIQKEILN